MCISYGIGGCWTSNVSYEIVCNRDGCKDEVQTSQYTACRGREHLKGLELMKEDLVLA